MKQSWTWWLGQRISASLVLIALFYACGPNSTSSAQSSSPSSAGTGTQLLNSESQAWLRTTIASGNFADLRWPDFSDYRDPVKKFYELNSDSLTWVKGMNPTPQAQQLVDLLSQADHKGLSADDYDGPRWKDRLAKLKRQASEADALKFDIALTVCAMRYISDLHIGRVNPQHFAFAFNEESKKYDLAEFLKEHIVNASDVSGSLAQVEPPYPGYRRALQALQTYIELAKRDDGERLPAGKKTIAPGDTYFGVPRLTRLLRLVGDLPADANVPMNQQIYVGQLVEAVKSFQRRYGRDPNGRIDTQTLADLNVPLSRRVRQMQLTLERWRWLPDVPRRPLIVANIPEFRLRAYDYDQDFKLALTMKVVVGKAYGHHNTPVFSDTMEYVVFRPYWAVPFSITKGEMVPHLLRDPDYLAKKGFEVVDRKQNVVSSGTVTPEVLSQIKAGTLFVRQKPGPKDALGLVKFVFPNSYNVYMHDTPSTEFFARSRRDFSHGCIRLEKPADLAAWVLRDNPGWTPERIHSAMNGTAPQQVNLAHPLPVFIVYGTVIVAEDGIVSFYDDIYGYDAILDRALAKGYPYPR